MTGGVYTANGQQPFDTQSFGIATNHMPSWRSTKGCPWSHIPRRPSTQILLSEENMFVIFIEFIQTIVHTSNTNWIYVVHYFKYYLFIYLILIWKFYLSLTELHGGSEAVIFFVYTFNVKYGSSIDKNESSKTRTGSDKGKTK